MAISSQWEYLYYTGKMASFKIQQALLIYMGYKNGWMLCWYWYWFCQYLKKDADLISQTM